MNPELSVKVEDVHKYYRLGVKEQASDSMAGAIMDFFRSPLKNYRKYRSLYQFSDTGFADKSVLHALNGVSFEVDAGEVVGIIGTNGAGKSTLLKVLSRITAPTKGRVQIRGRVSSLLEVGTGFHPELTGSENIYLNGTILGMSKKEIDAKYDEIVAFSGVEDFLETPVKRYSSGMRVRLAFSVAAHLDPEILIVDEVLAVGDADFQRKCLEKMESVGQSGKTVLFISHSMPAVTRMCKRVLLLNKGQIVADGGASEVVSMYLRRGGSAAVRKWEPTDEYVPKGDCTILRSVQVIDGEQRPQENFDIQSRIGLTIEFEVTESGHRLLPMFCLINEYGINICLLLDNSPEWRGKPRPCGMYKSTVWIPGNLLSEGMLSVDVAMWTTAPKYVHQFHECNVVAFHVVDKVDGESARGEWVGELPGVIRPKWDWQTEYRA